MKIKLNLFKIITGVLIILVLIVLAEAVIYYKNYYKNSKIKLDSASITKKSDFIKPLAPPKYESISIKLEDYANGYIKEGQETNYILGVIEDVNKPYFTVKAEDKTITCKVDDDTIFTANYLTGENKGKVESADFSKVTKGKRVSLFSYKSESEPCPLVTGLTILLE